MEDRQEQFTQTAQNGQKQESGAAEGESTHSDEQPQEAAEDGGEAGENSENVKPPLQRARFRQQFTKTQKCRFFAKGHCWNGEACCFAHGEVDVRIMPNLTKTSVCKNWAQGHCPYSSESCRFAHGTGELRATASFKKTTLCRGFFRGHCPMGDKCRHAHSNMELKVGKQMEEDDLAAERSFLPNRHFLQQHQASSSQAMGGRDRTRPGLLQAAGLFPQHQQYSGQQARPPQTPPGMVWPLSAGLGHMDSRGLSGDPGEMVPVPRDQLAAVLLAAAQAAARGHAAPQERPPQTPPGMVWPLSAGLGHMDSRGLSGDPGEMVPVPSDQLAALLLATAQAPARGHAAPQVLPTNLSAGLVGGLDLGMLGQLGRNGTSASEASRVPTRQAYGYQGMDLQHDPFHQASRGPPGPPDAMPGQSDVKESELLHQIGDKCRVVMDQLQNAGHTFTDEALSGASDLRELLRNVLQQPNPGVQEEDKPEPDLPPASQQTRTMDDFMALAGARTMDDFMDHPLDLMDWREARAREQVAAAPQVPAQDQDEALRLRREIQDLQGKLEDVQYRKAANPLSVEAAMPQPRWQQDRLNAPGARHQAFEGDLRYQDSRRQQWLPRYPPEMQQLRSPGPLGDLDALGRIGASLNGREAYGPDMFYNLGVPDPIQEARQGNLQRRMHLAPEEAAAVPAFRQMPGDNPSRPPMGATDHSMHSLLMQAMPGQYAD